MVHVVDQDVIADVLLPLELFVEDADPYLEPL